MFKTHNILTSLFIILIISHLNAFAHKDDFIEPTSDFNLNFCNFPQAWQVSKGACVHIGIVFNLNKTEIDWVAETQRTAPEAKVSRIDKTSFLSLNIGADIYNIILILEPIKAEEYATVLKAIHTFTGRETAIILPAYFSPIIKDYDYSPLRKFIKQASDNGAIIVGTHGREFQLGDLSFWKDIPVDIYALHWSIMSFEYGNFDSMVKAKLERSSYLVAGALALLISSNPKLNISQIKTIFKENGRKLTWPIYENGNRTFAIWNYLEYIKDKRAEERIKSKTEKRKTKEVFEGTCLDAGMILGLEPLIEGEFCYQALNVKKVQQIATGKGVKVAILDWLFKKDAPSFK